jgi:hypothetical protein
MVRLGNQYTKKENKTPSSVKMIKASTVIRDTRGCRLMRKSAKMIPPRDNRNTGERLASINRAVGAMARPFKKARKAMPNTRNKVIPPMIQGKRMDFGSDRVVGSRASTNGTVAGGSIAGIVGSGGSAV